MLNNGSDLIQAFQKLNSERERTVAVQWEPAGRSNRAVSLGVTQRTTAASQQGAAALTEPCTTKCPIEDLQI